MMKSKSLVTKLKEKLKEKSLEELKVIWESGNHLDSVGMKVTDWLKRNNMKNLEQLKNETAEELNYWGYREFKDLLEQGLLTPESVEEFMELYATNRVKEVENYYKAQDDEEQSDI